MSLYGPDGKPLDLSWNQKIDELIAAVQEATKTQQDIHHSLDNFASTIISKSQLKEVLEKQENTYDQLAYRQQWWVFGAQAATFLATALAFLAALKYANIADEQRMSSDMQLATMIHQIHVSEMANEIAGQSADTSRQQADITRQQLVSTQAAIIEADVDRLSVQGDGINSIVQVSLMNQGIVNGWIKGNLTLTRHFHSPERNLVIYSKNIPKIIMRHGESSFTRKISLIGNNPIVWSR